MPQGSRVRARVLTVSLVARGRFAHTCASARISVSCRRRRREGKFKVPIRFFRARFALKKGKREKGEACKFTAIAVRRSLATEKKGSKKRPATTRAAPAVIAQARWFRRGRAAPRVTRASRGHEKSQASARSAGLPAARAGVVRQGACVMGSLPICFWRSGQYCFAKLRGGALRARGSHRGISPIFILFRQLQAPPFPYAVPIPGESLTLQKKCRPSHARVVCDSTLQGCREREAM